MELFRPTYAEIDLTALAGNIGEIRKAISPGTKIMGIVKANAYGHGAVEVAKTAENSGVDYLGVACLGEALEIRSAAIKIPILILSEIHHEHIERALDADITQAIYTFETAQLLSDIAKQKGRTAKIHVKVDTGMGRVGVLSENALPLIKRITSLPNIFLEGVFTHFSHADDAKSDFTAAQFEKFKKLLKALKNEGINIPIAHAANSAAALFFPQTHLDMVRIGICMYGLRPSENADIKLNLKPILSFKTKVLHVKEVPPDSPLSYGATHITAAKTNIATLPVGYADGLSRRLSNRGHVLIKGKKYPIVGRVTMDMTLADTGRDTIKAGDDAVIIGRQGSEEISADDVARIDETINYEVVCGIGKRVPRVYIF